MYKRGDTYWYSFLFAERRIQESAKTHSKTVAREAEKQRRRELEQGYNNIPERRAARIGTYEDLAEAFLEEYKIKHERSAVFAEYAIGHTVRHLGRMMVVDLDAEAVKGYQTARLKEGTAPKSINDEVVFLLRILGDQGDAIRSRLRRARTLKLATTERIGKPYSPDEKALLLAHANAGGKTLPSGEKRSRKKPGTRSPFIRPVLQLALNGGMRSREMRELTWAQIDFDRRRLTVGRSKTAAGEGRLVPLNVDLLNALKAHAEWYKSRFGELRPDWYLFPGRLGKPKSGDPRPYDPSRPISTLKTSWKNVKIAAGVEGRMHDARHTLITEMGERGVGEETIMSIVGHVSRRMLTHYSHIRMEAKRRAVEPTDNGKADDKSAAQADGRNL